MSRLGTAGHFGNAFVAQRREYRAKKEAGGLTLEPPIMEFARESFRFMPPERPLASVRRLSDSSRFDRISSMCSFQATSGLLLSCFQSQSVHKSTSSAPSHCTVHSSLLQPDSKTFDPISVHRSRCVEMLSLFTVQTCAGWSRCIWRT